MTTASELDVHRRSELWFELGQQLRVDSIRSTAVTNSGHPTSAMSAADLMAVLLEKYLRYDFRRPDHPNNDHLIFSKGHASPLLYALYKAAGAIDDEQLLGMRRFGSPLEGHPSPTLPWVDVATGSLGFGLPVGVGIALAKKKLDPRPCRVWVLCGDSEMAEGSVWEALEHAAFWGLDNLTVIVDVNRLGQSTETMHGWDTSAYVDRALAARCDALAIDGHRVDEIDEAYAAACASKERPTVIVAKTTKGKGVAAVADKPGWHGKALDDPEAAIEELGGVRELFVLPAEPLAHPLERGVRITRPALPSYGFGTMKATRRAYGEALAAIGAARDDIVAMDGEVSNSTFSGLFAEAHPERFVEMYVAEQQMIAACVGFDVAGWKPFASAFAAFFSRAYDFIRMASISRASINLCGSHAGVATGEDGPSQMALEDIAMIRAINDSTVLYPCDANQTAKLVALMPDVAGVTYLRTTRAETPVIYARDEEFRIGGSRVLRESDDDAVTIVAAGITVHEALAAAERLLERDIRVCLIDAYSVKPIDGATIAAAARATDGRVVTVEDHWPEGGLGEATLSALGGLGLPLRLLKLAVPRLSTSGTPGELLAAAEIDADAIVNAVEALLADES